MATARDPETNPAAFLGAELRRARLAAGFNSQDALATRLGFDRTVIAKAETGDRPPTVDVLSAWCEACTLDSDLFGRMAILARRADGAVPSWFEGWLEAEREAHTLRVWSPLLVPGLLQTADYARTLFLAAGFTDDQANELTGARLERQAILERAAPPQVTFVLDETVLHRQIGSYVTMAEQLEHIASVSELRNVNIHILPASDANAGLSGSFSIAGADGLPETLLMETVEDHTTQDRALVRRAAVIFDLVRSEALPRTPSRTFILEASEQWKIK
jgi:transcriptional regulator with XRE-family HTH domain